MNKFLKMIRDCYPIVVLMLGIFFIFIPYIELFFILTPNIRKIIDIGLEFFNFIPYIEHIGKIIVIVSFVLYSMAIYSVSKAAASKSLFINYIIAVIISFLGFFVFFVLSPPSGVSGVIFLVTMIALIIAAIYLYKIHDELARLSGSSLFLWSFWIYTASMLLCFSVFGIFVGFAGFIMAWMLLFIAWWRFGKLEKR